MNTCPQTRALTRTLTTISSRQISGAAERSMPSSVKFEPTVAEATTKMRRIAPDFYKPGASDDNQHWSRHEESSRSGCLLRLPVGYAVRIRSGSDRRCDGWHQLRSQIG